MSSLVTEVWGLDSRSRAWHVCTPRGYGSHVVGASVPTDEARIELAGAWSRFLSAQSPKRLHVVCEEPLSLKNGKTNRVLAMAAAAVHMATFHKRTGGSVQWEWVDVESWKRHVIGRGGVDKAGVRDWVRTHCGLEFQDQDHYDACAIRVYGMVCRSMLPFVPLSIPAERKLAGHDAAYNRARAGALQAALQTFTDNNLCGKLLTESPRR